MFAPALRSGRRPCPRRPKGASDAPCFQQAPRYLPQRARVCRPADLTTRTYSLPLSAGPCPSPLSFAVSGRVPRVDRANSTISTTTTTTTTPTPTTTALKLVPFSSSFSSFRPRPLRVLRRRLPLSGPSLSVAPPTRVRVFWREKSVGCQNVTCGHT